MAYVVREDIIANIDETYNIIQGTSHTYSIDLYRDYIGNFIAARNISVISVALLNNLGQTILIYNNPPIPGVSANLILPDSNLNVPGRIQFEIMESQSRYLDAGDLLIQITLVYSDFFPSAKTYILPALKIGQVIQSNDNGGGTDPVPGSNLLGMPLFDIEYIGSEYPSAPGKMSINSQNPGELTQIIFRNLDKNLTRSITLENFLVNRMGIDKINGVITIYSTTDNRFFTIYKIIGWERIDIVNGNGDADNSDGIKINVMLESVSSGPGITKTLWQIGDTITFAIDTHGINGTDIKQDGISTFADKNKKVTIPTNGQGSPTGVYITHSPYYDSYVMVEVNGISVDLGNNKITSTSYFSGNNGLTAVETESIRSGDQLIWNGNIAGFELEIGDEINLIYEVNVDDLR